MQQSPYTTKSNLCRICNAKAHIINYGALSCFSCKTFFRRHAHRIQNVPSCPDDGHCEITLHTRKICTSCRLAKCFAVGMSPEFIRKKFQKKPLRSSMESNNREIALHHQLSMSLPQITSLDLLYNDRSSLTTSEWRLISNVIHAFDKFSLVPSIRYIIEHFNIVKPSINIDVSQTFDLVVSVHTSMESFITSTADFRVLSKDEQCSLFQRNLHGLFNFYGTFIFRDGEILSNTKNENILVPMYGHDIIHQVKRINIKMDMNSTLIKIMCIIFAFSTNCYTINFDKDMNRDALLRGTFRLFGSQNMYVTILWKYMLYRYGYMEAVLRFAGLIKQILDLITISASTYNNNVQHQILVDDVVEQAKAALTLNDINLTPLWGKL